MNEVEQRIVEIFRKRIRGRKPNVSASNSRHDGKYGHCLETQFTIGHNASNSADLFGYELKNETGSKTTFGDWSANEYIYNNSRLFRRLRRADETGTPRTFSGYLREGQRGKRRTPFVVGRTVPEDRQSQQIRTEVAHCRKQRHCHRIFLRQGRAS